MKNKPIVAALFAIICQGLAAQNLVIGVGEGNSEPYSFVSNDVLTGGIIKDIGDALGRDLGIKVSYLMVFRKRVDNQIINGMVHILPIFNPAWTDKPDIFLWSHPLFPERNVFVMAKARAFPLNQLDDLAGKRIGTNIGYFYPTLEPFFATGKLVRDDVTSLKQNLAKLSHGRIDVLIDSQILLNYYLKTARATAPTSEFVVSDLIASSQDIYFAYSKQLPVAAAKITAALDKMRQSGEIERILERYR